MSGVASKEVINADRGLPNHGVAVCKDHPVITLADRPPYDRQLAPGCGAVLAKERVAARVAPLGVSDAVAPRLANVALQWSNAGVSATCD